MLDFPAANEYYSWHTRHPLVIARTTAPGGHSMIHPLSVIFSLLLTVGFASAALAQEEAHYEGYSIGSNPNPESGTPLNARGLVTALYSPLVSDFVTNEYTWVVEGLIAQGSVLSDSQWVTTYVPGG